MVMFMHFKKKIIDQLLHHPKYFNGKIANQQF